jgi:hypothetical protein
MAIEPSAGAERLFREPLKPPIAVLQELVITTSFI